MSSIRRPSASIQPQQRAHCSKPRCPVAAVRIRSRRRGRQTTHTPRAVLVAVVLMSLLPAAFAQVTATADYLARMDRDGDGRISLAEYQDWLSYGFDAMDRNHDGLLDADEQPRQRGAASVPLGRGEYRARLAAAFNRQDVDRDGSLTAAELAAPPQ